MPSLAQIGPVFAPTPSPATRRTPALPECLFFAECLGSRQMPEGGYALRLRFAYRSPRGPVYSIEAAPLLSSEEAFTGHCYVKSCTCPDHQKRRGAAAPHSRERVCKHMQLVAELVMRWQGRQLERPEWLLGSRPAPVRPYSQPRKRASQAQRQGYGWGHGTWEPATGWESPAASRAATEAILEPRHYAAPVRYGEAG